MNVFDLLKVLIVAVLVNIFLTVTMLLYVVIQPPAPLPMMRWIRKGMFVFGMLVLAAVAVFVWLYAFSLPV